jgi:uncharacterized protein YbjT (DUF2867 family)
MSDTHQASYFVFGAGKGLGYQFARELRADSQNVSALVRDRIQAERLESIGVRCSVGDATRPQDVRAALAGLPADSRVISTLGSFQSEHPVDFEGHRIIIDAMEELQLRQMLLVTSWGCGDTWKWLSPRFREIIGQAVRLKSLAETWLMTSRLDYRILRPVGLIDGEATGAAVLSQNQEVHGLVRRADVAKLGLALLRDPSTIGSVHACHDPSLEKP